MAEIKNIQRLDEFVRFDVERYVINLLKLHAENIVSVSVYGSAASGHFIANVSDVNLMVVVNQLDFSVLKVSLDLVKQGMNKKINAPLFLTEDYISRSLDVFPIEFFEMKEHYVLLYGKDVLGDLVIPAAHLRIFCEQQLKGKLLRIRQAYLECGLNDVKKVQLLKDSVKSLIPVFGNLLRLQGISIPNSKELILNLFAQEFKIEASGMIKIYRYHTENKKIPVESIDGLLTELLTILERITFLID
jgi:predicted nucleotidyltransferase